MIYEPINLYFSLVCVKIVQNKSTGDISPFPFVSGWLSTCLWLRYGIYIQESSITLVNTIGAILFFAYVCTFLFYTLKKVSVFLVLHYFIYYFLQSIVIRQFLTCSIFLTIILIYVGNEDSFEDGKRSLGIICSFVTIVFFAAPLASFFHVITVKSSESLSFPMIFANFIVSSQWLMYGILLNDAFLKVE